MTEITRCAFSEVSEFITILSEKHRRKLPEELIEYFERERDKDYNPIIDPNIPIKDQNLIREALAIIASLDLKYWCENEEENKRLRAMFRTNEILHKERLVLEWINA